MVIAWMAGMVRRPSWWVVSLSSSAVSSSEKERSAKNEIAAPRIFNYQTLGSGWTGRLTARYGVQRVIMVMTLLMLAGLLATLSEALPLLLAGVALATFGYFGAHAGASAWVGRRAREARGLASALYLSAYYAGSSLLGSVSGLVWHLDGWSAVVALLATLLAGCLLIAWRLRRLAASEA